MGKQALVLALVLLCRIARAGGDREAEAKQLYKDGVTQYDLGEYDRAIEKFKAAYELSPAPRLLFDIAQAYRLKGGNCRNAVQFYRTYLRVAPDADNRVAVQQWLRELEPCAQKESEPPPSVPPPNAPVALPVATPKPTQPPPEPSTPYLRWTLLAGGGALLLAGGGVLAWTVHDFDAAKSHCAPTCNETRDRLQLRADISYALLAIGSVAAASGAVLWIRGDDSTEANAYVAPAPTGVVIGGRF